MTTVMTSQELCADAVNDLLDAYRRLGDPRRDEELDAVIKLFRLAIKLNGEEGAVALLRETIAERHKEVDESL